MVLISKFILLFGLLVFGLSARPIEAEGIKDNRLKINDQRLEEEENDTIGDRSDLIGPLFQAESEGRFKAYRSQQEQEENQVLAGLFFQKNLKKPALEVEGLFVSEETTVSRYATHRSEETDSQFGLSVNGLWLGLIYGGFTLLVFLVAGFASYRINKGMTDELTY